MSRFNLNPEPRFTENELSAQRDAEAEANSELSALRARVAELEDVTKRQGKFLDLCSDVHNHNVRLKEKLDAALTRLAALEAPPVVPEGVRIERKNDDNDSWDWEFDDESQATVTLQQWVAVYRAIAWAIETGERPPHESDADAK